MPRKIIIDLDELPGRLSVALVDPKKVEQIARIGITVGEFLGRDVPSHVLAQELTSLLSLLGDEVEPPGESTNDRS